MASPSKILITDDDALVREAVEKILELFGHTVISTSSGPEALEVIEDDLDVIILDINMPGMDGFETMTAINEKKLGIPVLFLTGAGSMEYAVKAINLGAYDFIPKPIEDLDMFDVKIKRAIEKRMYVRREKACKANLESEIQAKTKELAEKNVLLEDYSHQLEESALSTILTLQTAMEEKDQYTAGHTLRVTRYAQWIGQALNLPNADMVVLERASQLHDIGKLVLDNSCIQKPGPLDKEEWILIKKHPAVGANIIKPLLFLDREGDIDIVLHHHERMDGTGYPDGMPGAELDILTRIITVADSFDAMTSMRSYRVNLSRDGALAELRRCAGTQFDPDLVEVLAGVLPGKN